MSITKGTIQREELEAENKRAIAKQQAQSTAKHFTKAAENEVLGIYKRTVIDAFIGTFNENYGNNFDYNSLIGALNFTIRQDKNGLHPDFSFKESGVDFKGKIHRECREFNENAKQEFISNDDIISGNINLRRAFGDKSEYDTYESGEKNYESLKILDGEFTSLQDNERYGEFNRINKLVGYSTTQESGKQAKKIAEGAWNKAQDSILGNVIKKFKI